MNIFQYFHQCRAICCNYHGAIVRQLKCGCKYLGLSQVCIISNHFHLLHVIIKNAYRIFSFRVGTLERKRLSLSIREVSS